MLSNFFWGVLKIISFAILSPFFVYEFFRKTLPYEISEWKLFRKVQNNPSVYKKYNGLERAMFISTLQLLQTKWYVPASKKAELKKLENELFNVECWVDETFR